MFKRKLRYVLLALLAASLALAVGRWYQVTTRPEYRLRQGEEALRRSNWDDAERIINQLEASGHPAHAHLLRGEAYLRRNDNLHAVAEFRQIPHDQEDLYLAAAPLYGQAVLRFDRAEAEAAFRYVLEKRPDDVNAHRALAEIYSRQRALLRAREHLLALARLEPNDGRAYRYLGQIDMAYERYPEAEDHFEEALRRGLKPEDVEEARKELALALFERKKFAQVLKLLDSCQPATLEMPEYQRLRAECLYELSQVSDARALLDSALAKYPRCLSLLRLRAKVYLADRKPAEALPVLEQALASSPRDLESHHLLAQVYQRLHEPEKAAEQQRLAKEAQDLLATMDRLGREALRNPWDAAVRRRLAAMARDLGRYDMAKLWEEAAAACPQAGAGTVSGRG